jgi:MFS family permease
MKERGSSVFRFLYSQHFTIFTIAISVFSDLFLYGFVIILLPDLLRRRCEVPEGQIQGTLAVLLALYNGIIVFATPLSGYLADRLSNKRTPFLISLVALGGATFLFALGTTTTVLGLARLLQGVSAAVVWSVGLALLTDTVGTGAIGNAMGWIQIAISLGSITGPLAGGVLYTQVGHNGTFAFAVGLVGVDVIMRMLNRDPPSPVVGVEEEGQQRPQCEESLAGSAPPSVMAPGERTPLLKDQPDQNSPGEAKTAKAGSFVLLKLLMDPEVPFHLMFSATAMMSQTAYETVSLWEEGGSMISVY